MFAMSFSRGKKFTLKGIIYLLIVALLFTSVPLESVAKDRTPPAQATEKQSSPKESENVLKAKLL